MSRARALFDAGARSFEQGDFEAAIQAFEQAHRVVPRDNLIFSIAQAHKKQFAASGELRHLHAAVAHYRRYVDAVPTGGRRADAVAALEELALALARRAAEPETEAGAATSVKTRLWISSRTPGATFSLDDGPPQPVGRSVEVAPGRHRVRFSAPGHLDQTVSVEAIRGELVPESLDLVARPARLGIAANAGTSVFVDGRFVGEAPLPDALSLPPGRHFISLSLRGHVAEGTTIELEGGRASVVEADLATTGQRDVASAFLVTGGTFLAASGTFLLVSGIRHGQARELYRRHLTENVSVADVEAYADAVSQRDRFALAGAATGLVGTLAALVGVGLFVFDESLPLSVPADLDRPAPAPSAPTLELGGGPLGAVGTLRGSF